MFDLSEDSIARLLIRDAQQLADRAKEIGVTAYTQKPVPRLRPNGQFLQATLRNIESGNRRAEENAMWRQRRAQLTGARDNHAADVSSNEGKDGHDSGLHSRGDDDGAVMAFLSSKPKRGRGGVGSRVEETGPYLPAESGSGRHLTARDSSGINPGDAEPLGPHCPDWIRQASDQADDVMTSLQTLGSKHHSRHDASLPLKHKGVGKHKKDKSHKKTKKKKRHKLKHTDNGSMPDPACS